MTIVSRVSLIAALCLSAAWADTLAPTAITFDEGSAEALQSDGVEFVEGRTGKAARIDWGDVLAYSPPAFLTEGFDIRLWVRHQASMEDLFFEEPTYLYLETPDGKNRIHLQKRMGTNYILFSMSDGTGRAKGAQFSGNWFAMKSPDLDWPANTWHELRIIACRAAHRAALFIDGEQVAAAEGTEMPQELGERLWIGSLKRRSQMLGDVDDITIAPYEEGEE